MCCDAFLVQETCLKGMILKNPFPALLFSCVFVISRLESCPDPVVLRPAVSQMIANWLLDPSAALS